MLLESIDLTNSSFFPLGLRPLNVLVGPNAAGKAHLISAISLLKAAAGYCLLIVIRGS
jgi:AAA15 family ATPase/GTPase